jgi:dTDP-4-amino-4,6-dideoxygalactose transaminase
VGSWGDAGCFSFFPTKNLGCCGDGGMVVYSDQRMDDQVEMLRRHGGRKKYHHEVLGFNSRLDELQAAILRVKRRQLDAWNQARRDRAYRYNRLLESLNGVVRPAEVNSHGVVAPTTADKSSDTKSSDIVHAVYHQYTLLVDDRDTVQTAFSRANIGCAAYYPVPLHRQVVHRNLGYRGGAFPVAEQVSRHCLSLPMFAELTDVQQDIVVESLAAAIAPAVPFRRAA